MDNFSPGEAREVSRGVEGEGAGGDVARQATGAPSAKLCVLTSQLEKSNSCAIVLNDFNNCKNSEYFLRVPRRAEMATAPWGIS